MTIFAFRPNWSDPFLDRLEWLTNVLPSRNGTEQRVRLRDVPRRSFEFSVAAVRNEFQYLDTLLAAKQSNLLTVPFWPDKSSLPITYASGATVFAIDTSCRDYHVGGKLVLGTDALHCEELTILSLTSSSVTTVAGSLRTWLAGSYIVPARACRLNPSMSVVRPTAKVSTARVQFTVDDLTSIDAAWDTSYQFASVEVMVRKPNRVDNVTAEYRRLQEILDYTTGVTEIDDLGARPFNVRSYSYLLKDRAAIQAYRAWLHQRAGQAEPFWSPTWERNFELHGTQDGGATLIVENQGMSTYLNGVGGRGNIAMRRRDGTWVFRAISSCATNADPDLENIVLATAVGGGTTTPSDWSLCCFMEHVVLNSDAVEISYVTNSVATANVATRSVTV
jgi:hypothetical protein